MRKGRVEAVGTWRLVREARWLDGEVLAWDCVGLAVVEKAASGLFGYTLPLLGGSQQPRAGLTG
jgi:hypothetical protein